LIIVGRWNSRVAVTGQPLAGWIVGQGSEIRKSATIVLKDDALARGCFAPQQDRRRERRPIVSIQYASGSLPIFRSACCKFSGQFLLGGAHAAAINLLCVGDPIEIFSRLSNEECPACYV
jgi:hypothetical protein